MRLLCVVGVALLCLEGCAYRLYAPSPPVRELIKIVDKSPNSFIVHVGLGTTDYQVPSDGRLVVMVPGYRPSCGVYLFDWIKVGGGKYPTDAPAITVMGKNKIVRRLSVKQITSLPIDSDGYRLLTIAG
jgi:hypothetical protein